MPARTSWSVVRRGSRDPGDRSIKQPVPYLCEDGATPATPAVTPTAPATEPALPAPAAPAGDEVRADGSRRRGLSELAAEDRSKLLAAVPHIREWQRLRRAGTYAAALAAFEQAHAEAPDDPGALCEAGWQAFRLERLDRARELLERGARLSRIPSRRYDTWCANDDNGELRPLLPFNAVVFWNGLSQDVRRQPATPRPVTMAR